MTDSLVIRPMSPEEYSSVPPGLVAGPMARTVEDVLIRWPSSLVWIRAF